MKGTAMKRLWMHWLLSAAALLAMPVQAAQAIASPPLADPRPDADSFFSSIGIAAHGQQKHFVVGDNIDGYLDAMTASYRRGAGYLIGKELLLQDLASYVDGKLIDRRTRDAHEIVYPYGRRVRLGQNIEQTVLHAGSRRLSVLLSTERDALLAVQPLWAKGRPGKFSFEWQGEVLVVKPFDSPLLVAISSPQGFELVPGNGSLEPDQALLRARAPGREFILHMAFGTDTDQVAAQAAEMAHTPDLIAQTRARLHARLTRSWLASSDPRYNQALHWAKASALSFEVQEFGPGLWAGLPWFRDNWGRDTFIALPGTLLVSGQFKQARDILENFARYQNLQQSDAPSSAQVGADATIGARASDYGRIPNRVNSEEIIYNTVDGTPWMLREALEYVRYSGDQAFAARALQVAGPYIEGALRHSIDADGLLVHEAADTWMDARIEGRQAWSPRGNRAVEIQALWYTALQAAAELADQAGDAAQRAQGQAWRAHAARTKANFLRLFWDGRIMADRLRGGGSRDLSVRPNQLMLISVPFDGFVPPAVEAAVLRNTVSELLFPYGIASLSPKHPYFHPHHVNDALYHKDAAYHNGTIWGWNAGFTVTALSKYGEQDLGYRLSQNLADQILGLGTLGTMSELLDALPLKDGSLKASGTFAQAWSVAEFARNAYQDYLGFRPDLPRNTLHFVPALPAAWRHVDAVLPFGGDDEALIVRADQRAGGWVWHLRLKNARWPRELVIDALDASKARQRSSFTLAPNQTATLEFTPTALRLNGRPLDRTLALPSQAATIGHLHFAPNPINAGQRFPVTQSPNALRDLVLGGQVR